MIWLAADNPDSANDQTTIKVLCVDDNDLVADAIQFNLEHAGGFTWLGHLPDADRLSEHAAGNCPDVVLLDIDMPGKDPFQAMRELALTCPSARVLMVTALVRDDLVDRAIEAGAWGYLSKRDSSELVSAIERVAAGEFVISAEPAALYSN